MSQLQNTLKQRGVPSPLKFLVHNGFTYHTAHRLLHNNVDSISFPHLEKLCVLLNCTINDLFVWHKAENSTVADTHPINKLSAQPSTVNISQTLLQLPYDKIAQLEKLVNELKNS